MNLVIEKSEKNNELKKQDIRGLKKNFDSDDKSLPNKYSQVTEGLKKRLHDFWYGWVWVD